MEREASTGALPEMGLGNVLAPELLPASNGPPVNTEERGKLTDSPRRRSVPHGADQNDEGADIDLSAEEAHGRCRGALSAAVAIATETEPGVVCIGQRVAIAPRLAGIIGSVQAPTARTSMPAGSLREVLVDREKEGPKAGGGRKRVIHRWVLRV